MREIRTSDVFEASYYRAEGLEMVALEARADLPGGSECVFVLAGEPAQIEQLASQYLTGRAVVNLMRFKRCYWESCQNIRNAKRQLKPQGGTR